MERGSEVYVGGSRLVVSSTMRGMQVLFPFSFSEISEILVSSTQKCCVVDHERYESRVFIEN